MKSEQIEFKKGIKWVESPVENCPKGEKWSMLEINAKHQYYISTKGRIYSFNRSRLLNLRKTKSGVYLEYTPDGNNFLPTVRVSKSHINKAYKDGKRYQISVHRLMAFAFLVQPNKKCKMVIHKDCDVLNNDIRNIQFAKTLNYAMFVRKNNKLLVRDVVKIRKLFARKNPPGIATTARKYNITTLHLNRILSGQTWASVGGPISVK